MVTAYSHGFACASVLHINLSFKNKTCRLTKVVNLSDIYYLTFLEGVSRVRAVNSPS